jgi:threonylcarbamoyladenosine tRNA methylthiotransferase MtaB
MNKFKVVTLGCKVNSYESEAVSNIFEKSGWKRIEENPNVIIINTCSVTSTSDSKSRQRIRHEIKENPNAVVCVMGCYSQVKADEVKKIDGVSIVIGTKYRNKLLDLVMEYEKNKKQIVMVEDSNTFKKFEDLNVIDYFSNTRAYLKIQDGCNNFCSYCIIPYTRGRVRSKDRDLIINEANNLVSKGYKELVLTGIHTGGYGIDLKNYRFENLLRNMSKEVKGIERIRISSIEIHELNEEVIKIMKENHMFVNHFHIPLQSGCNDTLKRMNRKYDVEYFIERVQRLRESFNECNLTTDVIVGFPGETEEDFKITCENIKKIGFTKIHVFPFSSREGTVASKLPNQIDGNVKKQRVNTLISLSKELGKAYYSKFIDAEIEVLFETYDNESRMLSGYTSNYIKVNCLGKGSLINKICKVKLLELIEKDNDYEMKGEFIDELR